MTLVKYRKRPSMMNTFFDDVFARDSFFRDFLNGESVMTPSANVRETEKSFEIELAARGFDKKELNIELNNRVLTLSGIKEEKREDTEENYTFREFSYNTFRRSFNLPEGIDEEHIQANYEKGILHVSLPKSDLEKGVRRISVK